MNKDEKIAGILLVLTMMISVFSVTAAAVDDGSITISNATSGETYSIYKLLDLTYDANKTSYAYTIDSSSNWYDFFTGSGAGAAYVSVDANTGVVTWTDGNTGTDSQAQALAQAALAYAESNNISPTASDTASGTTLTFSNLAYGYYLVDSSLGTVLTLDSTEPNVTVTDKNTSPTVTKTVMEDSTGTYGSTNTADIAETVYFRIEIDDAYASSNLVLHDTLSSGLTLDTSSFAVQVGASQSTAGTTVDSQYYTITTTGLNDGCTFEISFTDTFTSSILTNTQVIIITYTATVNENAVIGSTGNPNTTHVSYGNASTSTASVTTTYVYELNVYKYTTDANSSEVALADASFYLYREVNGTKYYAVLNSSNKITGWTTTQGDATVLTTGSTGLISFIGIDAGTYYLVESAAPTGYNLLAAATTIVVGTDGTITGAQTVTIGTDNYTAIKIYNGSSEEMPSTGGIGTTIFYIIGGALVLGAVVLLVVRLRMRRD